MDWKRTSKYILRGLKVAPLPNKGRKRFYMNPTSRKNVVENRNKNPEREPKMKRNKRESPTGVNIYKSFLENGCAVFIIM